MKRAKWVAAVIALFSLWANAQSEPASQVVPPKPCSSAGHRAFDFWLGEWQVSSPQRPDWLASSSITASNNGCSIHEAYSTPGGYAGSSVNFFDSNKGLWHQTWIDNQGAPLYLEGNLVDGVMVLSDQGNRISWTLQADQQVRQHWQTSTDGGKTWATAFDGYYRKRSVR